MSTVTNLKPKEWPIPAVISVIIQNGKALLVQRRNEPDANLWGFPGGKIELGETIEEAAERELLEETSIKGKAKKIFSAHSFIDKNNESIDHHFVILSVICEWVSGEAKAGDDAKDTKWIKLSELKNIKDELVPSVELIAEKAYRIINENSEAL